MTVTLLSTEPKGASSHESERNSSCSSCASPSTVSPARLGEREEGCLKEGLRGREDEYLKEGLRRRKEGYL